MNDLKILVVAGVAGVAGLSFAAWILRFEVRHQLRAHRRRGYIQIGGSR